MKASPWLEANYYYVSFAIFFFSLWMRLIATNGDDSFGWFSQRGWSAQPGNSPERNWDDQRGWGPQPGSQRGSSPQPGNSGWGGNQYYRREQQEW